MWRSKSIPTITYLNRHTLFTSKYLFNHLLGSFVIGVKAIRIFLNGNNFGRYFLLWAGFKIFNEKPKFNQWLLSGFRLAYDSNIIGLIWNTPERGCFGDFLFTSFAVKLACNFGGGFGTWCFNAKNVTLSTSFLLLSRQ